ncbi:hypothetical protein HK097_011575 [Rhizophlyctis rosea]|uniref:ADP-ribosylglycohydrolase n=1 Tax=Rhizophlyctis rosea TaxID=64517 RepID=A0AAD5S7X6_9FUNG|nr:hypothetical protein HK097_011575 [Rhizophlyctis rosea]
MNPRLQTADPSDLHWTTLQRTEVADKIRGILFGAALGDAIGLATEFLTREESLHVYGPEHPTFAFGDDATLPNAVPFLVDPHRARWKVGDFTDDTDQQLLILLSFLRSGGTRIKPNDFAKRLQMWVKQGLRCLDKPPCGIGQTTWNIVTAEGYAKDPCGTARRYWERMGRKVAPNGAVMRTAIIGALLAPKGAEAVRAATDALARTTHADPRCVTRCVIVTSLIQRILSGTAPNTDLLRDVVNASVGSPEEHHQEDDEVDRTGNEADRSKKRKCGISHEKVPKKPKLERVADPVRTNILCGICDAAKSELLRFCFPSTLEILQLDDEDGIGYTYRTLGSGLWALSQLLNCLTTNPSASPASTFKSLITELTIQGGDADTNCAVAGALMGAVVGYSGLPKEWLKGLIHHHWLLGKVNAALELMGVLEGARYRWDEDDDTLVDGGKGLRSEEELDAWQEERDRVVQRLLVVAGRQDNEPFE